MTHCSHRCLDLMSAVTQDKRVW